jgi:hypothetical protein
LERFSDPRDQDPVYGNGAVIIKNQMMDLFFPCTGDIDKDHDVFLLCVVFMVVIQ